MPPGLMHQVFTHEHCICTGGHFMVTDLLPQTERARLVEREHGKFLTNEELPCIDQVIAAMARRAVALAEDDPRQGERRLGEGGSADDTQR